MIELVPLLQIQRELYALPRGLERFRSYIETLTDDEGDMELPLMGMNPMGHEHNSQLLDHLLEIDAEGTARSAVEDANRRLNLAPSADNAPTLRVALVVVDDLRGQWTNRYFTEASHRFDSRGATRRNWATVFCWVTERWTPPLIYQETLAAIYRTLYMQKHGFPKRLDAMLLQEGLAMHFAQMDPPMLDADDLEYSRAVVEPLMERDEFPTIFGVLYGDDAARSVGYQPIGLSERAGFAVAFLLAQEKTLHPEEQL